MAMGRFFLAFRAFIAVLFRGDAAKAVRLALDAPQTVAAPAAAAPTPSAPPAPKPAPKPVRSEALTLLAALQREGRLVDFLKEPIAGYSDAQIGAAVREVHRGCVGVLDRWFDLKPVVEQPESSRVELAGAKDAARVHIVGNATGAATAGQLRHPGWEATRCDLPQWTGTAEAARVVAPAEVEVN